MDTNDGSLLDGKVVKLHFACRAELPIGSSLRVTSANLWGSSVAAGNSLVTDQQDPAIQEKSLYSSSVELVTTPEEYPLWRTRCPVICAVNTISDTGMFQHRYRYLVVTPGASILNKEQIDSMDQMTSDGLDGVVHIGQWEDPFDIQTHGDDMKVMQKTFDELPFRSIDVDVSSFTEAEVAMSKSTDTADGAERTSDGIRIDTFNNPNDFSLQVYREIAAQRELDNDTMDEELLTTEELLRDKRIFLVCYHLPVNLVKNEVTGEFFAEFTDSLIAKTEHGSVTKDYDTYWLGTVSHNVENEEDRIKIQEVLKPLNCIPLFFTNETVDSFYYGMCKQILWPAFHNIDLLDIAKSGWGANNFFNKDGNYVRHMDSNHWDQSRLDHWWHTFQMVNQAFASALIDIVAPNDVVWVHDYHLLLLPKLLHEAEMSQRGERTLEMVFFSHIPFPTSQVFRELERGVDILEGMLHADVIGFHAFDHARHFLNASKRILGLSHESLVGGLIGVRYRGTKILITISNVSIEADVVDRMIQSQVVQSAAESIKLESRDRTIISGIDIAQGLSGVSLKLLAFERLLTDYPNWRDKVAMVQICMIPNNRKNDEADTLAHVRYLVKRIQKTFGSSVIHYEEHNGSDLQRERRLALWLSSDIFMAVPIREGLNLLPLEYVYSHKKPNSPGVTITSEFSAVCSILNGALRVNPYDIQASSTAMDTALTMSLEEKTSRHERDITFVASSSSGLWTRRVLKDLTDVTAATERESSSGALNTKKASKMDSVNPTEVQISSMPLDPKAVLDAFNAASKRILFVDFNGTIVMKEPPGKYLKREMLGTSGNKPPKESIDALIKLCEDPRNVVYVVSGDTERNIENAIGHIDGLGLASGNGGSLSHPVYRIDPNTPRIWDTSDLGVDFNAVKQVTLPILAKYTARSNGSFVKITSSSIGWSYYSCDPEWGNLLAKSLLEELEVELKLFDVRIVTLKGVVEVVPRKLNKGLVVKEVLKNTTMPDFVLCVGDDVSDEKMFTSLFSVIAQSCAAGGTIPEHAFTITVGRKVSNASYFVENASDVAELLISLSGMTYNTTRSKSWDLEDRGDMFES